MHDPLALTEIASGFFLILLRGALLVGGAHLLAIDYEVEQTLRTIHVTENLWGSYLMVCGAWQILVAGTKHSGQRFNATLAILLGIVVMAAAFWKSGNVWNIPVSLDCLALFYTFLLARILVDRKDQREREAMVSGE